MVSVVILMVCDPNNVSIVTCEELGAPSPVILFIICLSLPCLLFNDRRGQRVIPYCRQMRFNVVLPTPRSEAACFKCL